MSKIGRWIGSLLGTTLLGMILNVPLGVLVGWAVGLIVRAHKAGLAWVLTPAIAAGVFVFVVLTITYQVKVGPWLATFRPEAPSLRALADEADSYSAMIMRFENRDPEGNPVPVRPLQLAEALSQLNNPPRVSDDWARFDGDYGQGLRNLFHDFKNVGLVHEGEMSLFYNPRTADNRVALAFRLRQLSYQARQRG